MNILYISGYNAWDQISKGHKPSHHLYGIHEMIDHYSYRDDGSLYGVLKKGVLPLNDEVNEVDFYIWESVRKDIVKHIRFLIKNRNKYTLVYDCLNRASIWIGILKRLKLFNSKVITMLHHPSYKMTLNLSESDAYVFFNDEYAEIARKECARKEKLFHVNEWYPDSSWYKGIEKDDTKKEDRAFFIDNGKTERDRDLMIRAAELTQTRIDYPGNEEGKVGYARTYKIDLSDYVGMTKKLKSYGCIIVPIKRFQKEKIGPLGITSFLDCMALGLPVITSDNTCFADDVSNFMLGYTYKTGDIDGLVNAIRMMSTDKEYYDMCINNMNYYAEGRTIDLFSEKLVRIICSVINP